MANSRDVGVLVQSCLEICTEGMDVFAWGHMGDANIVDPGQAVGRVHIVAISSIISPNRILIETSDRKKFLIQVSDYNG